MCVLPPHCCPPSRACERLLPLRLLRVVARLRVRALMVGLCPLQVEDCNSLQTVELHVAAMTHLALGSCPSLEVLRLCAPALTHLDLQCVLLPPPPVVLHARSDPQPMS